VPIALAQIDDTLVSFLPAELTITAGARVDEAALSSQTGSARATHAVVAGLANGYIQYVTTPEEYRMQHYEGASNLYGPMTAPFLAERIAILAQAMDGADVRSLLPRSPEVGEAAPVSYETGPARERFARAEDEAALDEILPSRAPIGICTMSHPDFEPPAFCFWWGDGGPARVSLTSAPWIILAEVGQRQPLHVCGAGLFALGPRFEPTTCDPEATIDDRGLDFQTLAHDSFGDALVWSTLFRPTRAEWTELRPVRALQIVARDATGKRDVVSPEFSRASMPSPCTPSAERFCGSR
jgi:hypothetical protein